MKLRNTTGTIVQYKLISSINLHTILIYLYGKPAAIIYERYHCFAGEKNVPTNRKPSENQMQFSGRISLIFWQIFCQ